jgi:hypothetical protein
VIYFPLFFFQLSLLPSFLLTMDPLPITL